MLYVCLQPASDLAVCTIKLCSVFSSVTERLPVINKIHSCTALHCSSPTINKCKHLVLPAMSVTKLPWSGSILDNATYWLKITIFSLDAPLSGSPSENCQNVWHWKTRTVWLPDGEKILKIWLLVPTQHTNVTDRRMDRHHMTAYHRAAKTNQV